MSGTSQANAGFDVKPETVSAIKLPKEFRLVLECARKCAQLKVCPDKGQALGDIDWRVLVTTARRHRMVPWVYRSLRARPAEEIPTEVREQLRGLTQQIAIRSLF